MTQDERNQVAIALMNLSKIFNRALDRGGVATMLDLLDDLSMEAILGAIRAYSLDGKNRFFPLPAQLRDLILKDPDNEAKAIEAIERIKMAISMFGYCKESKALEYIGPIGWQIVRGYGGWSQICESDFVLNNAALAQARNRVADIYEWGGEKLSQAALEAPPTKTNKLTSAQDILRSTLKLINPDNPDPAEK